MAPGRRIATALVLAAAAAAACGKSAQEKAADRLQAECNGLVASHSTYRDARQAFSAADVLVEACSSSFTPLGGNDVCGDPTAGLCQSLWYWGTNDPGMCGPNGCWVLCEARMTQASITADSATAPVCASRFYREQPPPF